MKHQLTTNPDTMNKTNERVGGSPPPASSPTDQLLKEPVGGLTTGLPATNFFTQMVGYLEHQDVTMTIRQTGPGQLAVSLLPKAKVTDQVRDTIAPMVLTASAAALDEGFFSQLDKPLRHSQDFSADLSAWEASQEKAKLESKKAKQEKEEEDKKKKKADVHLARAVELMEAKKYAEAVSEAEKATTVAPAYEKAEKKLRELREETKIHQQASLFADAPDPVKTADTMQHPLEDTAARRSDPVDTAPVDTAPVDTAPVDTAPVDTAKMSTYGELPGQVGQSEATQQLPAVKGTDTESAIAHPEKVTNLFITPKSYFN